MELLYLKRIELFGFKSFSEKTEVIFSKGVTCIVGPNGCGKSNIADALRWVLGERSPKHLRSSQMTDVIFAGTESRKPLGLAEVNLVFDNHTRWLPLEFNEAVITRRLYSSGESEYLINKTRCRYRDIQALIVDTGLGIGSYSMMEQGRVDYILNATPEERRGLIEEAAGVAKYKSQKEEAIRKLTLTEENLTRLRDIVREVERNIKYAERQAKRAERYKTQLEKLKHLEITKAFLDVDTAKACEISLDREIALLQTEIGNLEQSQDGYRGTLNNLELRLSDCEKMLREQLELRAALNGKLEFQGARIAQLKAQIEELDQMRAAAVKDCSDSEDRLSALTLELESDRLDLDENADRESGSNIGQVLGENQAQLQKLKESIEEQKKLLANARNFLFETADAHLKKRNELLGLQSEFSREFETHRRLTESFERQSRNLEDLKKALNQLDAERQECVSGDNGDLEKYSEQLSRHVVLENEFGATTQKLNDNIASVSELATRMAVLKRLGQKGFLPYSTTRVLMTDSEGEYSTMLSAAEALTEVIKPKKGFEGLYRLAVGKFMDAVIVEEEAIAHQIVDYLTHKKWGEATILLTDKPLSAAMLSDGIAKHPLILGPAIDFVEYAPKHRPLAELILSGTYISTPWHSEHKSALLKLSEKSRLITEDGVVLGPGSRIQVGLRSEKADSDIALDQEAYVGARRRLWELEQESSALKKQKDAAAHALRSIKEELQISEPRARGAKIKLESNQRLQARIAEDIRRTESEIQVTRLDIENSVNRQRELDDQSSRTRFEAGRLAGQESAAKEQLGQATVRLGEMELEKDVLSQAVLELTAEANRLSDRKKWSSRSTASVQSNIDLLSSVIEEKKRIILNSQAKCGELAKSVRVAEAGLMQSKEEQERCSSEISRIEIEIEQLKQERRTSSGNIEDLHRRISGLKDQEHAKELERTHVRHEQDTVKQRIRQAYKIELDHLDRKEYPDASGVEIGALVEEMSRLKEGLESIGTVNLLAVEEYEELKTRFDFLSAQQNDLDASRESLLEAIRKINRTTRKLFQDTFHQVQANFEQYYRILFRGGHAELILLDEENPLESGIDIHVRPPGKKLQHISLLSGGEKALTTIALLFALFKVKPSPFCVLDEVDAPLDEANIDRFLDVLKEFLSTTQFLIITHNRKTIATGDTLYGVTMEESGVSSIVSVRISGREGSPLPVERETDALNAKTQSRATVDSISS
ncbi:MAG: chromosome segregation protein SMC [Candidatus Omnitrophica bacterium]|nr:chromosome segregation protein SMC [Candidatus Omnitrophota bacterium]